MSVVPFPRTPPPPALEAAADAELAAPEAEAAAAAAAALLPLEAALAAALAADCFIVLGSSLVVYPAAGLPVLAKRNGARLVILNREATEMDDIADLVINDSIGDILGAAVGVT